MTRKQALEVIKVAGYHNDNETFTRVYVENRISYPAAKEAFAKGVKAHENGVKCTCSSCNKS